jgi:hypothetical protein
MKTSELTGAALDWAVAKCEGIDVEVHSADMIIKRRLQSLTQEEAAGMSPPKPYLVVPGVGNANYSGDWAQGGPIIEREGIAVGKSWEHWKAFTDASKGEGPTPLIAAMRCYVASKLGDEVDVPEELCQPSA